MWYKKFRISLKALSIGFTAWLFSFFFYSPRFILFLGLNSGTTRRDNLLLQCLDPFSRNLFGQENVLLVTSKEMSNMYTNVFSINESTIISDHRFDRLNDWFINNIHNTDNL